MIDPSEEAALMHPDDTEQAVIEGEIRAEREYLLEQGVEVPDHLRPLSCLCGDHVYSMESAQCLYCGYDGGR